MESMEMSLSEPSSDSIEKRFSDEPTESMEMSLSVPSKEDLTLLGFMVKEGIKSRISVFSWEKSKSLKDFTELLKNLWETFLDMLLECRV